MAIRGSLKEASLPDVLQLLAMGKKTGCLSVTDRNNFGYVYFDKGRICYASIVNRRDRLGDILVKGGLISQEQLDAAVELQGKQRDKRLGEILVAMAAISREDLHQQMRVQIEEAVYFLFTWSQGTFNFEPDIRPEEQDFLVSINPESLLLEGARRVDEGGMIEKKIPSFDIIFEVDRARRVVELRPGDAHARFFVGLVMMKQGKWPDAANAFHEAASQRDAKPAVFHNLAYALERLGRYEEARAALDEAVRRGGGQDPRVQTSLGVLALRSGDIERAGATLAEARPLWGKRQPPAAWFHYAALTAALAGQGDRATQLLTPGAKGDPPAG